MKVIAYIRAADVFNDSRATKEIFSLAANGYKILIFCWDRSGKAIRECQRVFSEIKSNIEINAFQCPIINLGLKNSFKLLRWMKWVYNSLKKHCLEIDYVHACDFDAGYSAYKFCMKYNKKLIYDIFDYYVDSHSLPKVLKKWVERKETQIINFSDFTIICTEERRKQIANATPKNIAVIHNSPQIDIVEDSDECIDYAYCGSLADKRLVSEIFKNYEKNTNLKFSIAGYGIYKNMAIDLSGKYENFVFHDSIPYSEVLKIESKAKVLSAIYEPTCRNHQLCAPNKFYESLALAKPIIVCKGTGIDKIVIENDLGIVINYDANEFYSALKSLCVDEVKRKEMGKRARALYEEKYAWSKMEKILLNLYESISR